MQSISLVLKCPYFDIQIWPENTDPKKYVYEDVAIATYLLLLFEEERKSPGYHGDDRKQSFVDLGCGNGLLVHILNSEGVSILWNGNINILNFEPLNEISVSSTVHYLFKTVIHLSSLKSIPSKFYC